MEVVVDGKVVYEGILQAGTQKSWTASKQLILRSGNAGGVMVSVNDAPPKPMGKPGAVEEVTYKPQVAASPTGLPNP